MPALIDGQAAGEAVQLAVTRATPVDHARQDRTVIDQDALNELDRLLGQQKVSSLARAVVVRSREAVDRLAALADGDERSNQAHAVKGMAANLGATGIAKAMARIERGEAADKDALNDIVDRTWQAYRARYPEMAEDPAQ